MFATISQVHSSPIFSRKARSIPLEGLHSGGLQSWSQISDRVEVTEGDKHASLLLQGDVNYGIKTFYSRGFWARCSLNTCGLRKKGNLQTGGGVRGGKIPLIIILLQSYFKSIIRPGI